MYKNMAYEDYEIADREIVIQLLKSLKSEITIKQLENGTDEFVVAINYVLKNSKLQKSKTSFKNLIRSSFYLRKTKEQFNDFFNSFDTAALYSVQSDGLATSTPTHLGTKILELENSLKILSENFFRITNYNPTTKTLQKKTPNYIHAFKYLIKCIVDQHVKKRGTARLATVASDLIKIISDAFNLNLSCSEAQVQNSTENFRRGLTSHQSNTSHFPNGNISKVFLISLNLSRSEFRLLQKYITPPKKNKFEPDFNTPFELPDDYKTSDDPSVEPDIASELNTSRKKNIEYWKQAALQRKIIKRQDERIKALEDHIEMLLEKIQA